MGEREFCGDPHAHSRHEWIRGVFRMDCPGRPLTTGEGNTAAQFHIRREHLLEGSALDVDPPFASLDVVLWRDYEAECGRLRERERRLEKRADGFREVAKRQADKRASEVGRLREQLDAARQALRGVSNAYGCFAGCTGALAGAPADGTGHTPACRAARAALGVEGPAAGDGQP